MHATPVHDEFKLSFTCDDCGATVQFDTRRVRRIEELKEVCGVTARVVSYVAKCKQCEREYAVTP